MNSKTSFGLFLVLLLATSTYCQVQSTQVQKQQANTLCFQTAQLRLTLEKRLDALERVNIKQVQADIDRYAEARSYMRQALDILSPVTQSLVQKKQQVIQSDRSESTLQIQLNIFNQLKNVKQSCKAYESFQTKQYNKACDLLEQLQTTQSSTTNYCVLAKTFNQTALNRRNIQGVDQQIVCQTIYIIELMDTLTIYLKQVLTDERYQKLSDALNKVIASQKEQSCAVLQTRFVRIERGNRGADCLQIAQLQVFNLLGQEVAAKKKASASSQWDASSGPERAVDGDARPRSHPLEFHIGGGQCRDPKAWWEVDLGENFVVDRVVYYNRVDCCSERSVGLLVSLLDENKNVVAQYNLRGGMTETVNFATLLN